MKVVTLLMIVALAIAAGSCIKDDLTLPSQVTFVFELITEEKRGDDYYDAEIKSSTLNIIEQGTLVIDAVEFDGRRTAGRDVFFISTFPSAVKADLVKGKADHPVDFDIPQGVYNRIDITLHLDTVENIAFMIEGTLKAGPFNMFPFRFEYNFPDIITARATAAETTEIVLHRDRAATARVRIDVGFMFRFVNPGALATADLTNIGGVDYIIINRDNNIALFNQIASRLGGSVKVVFE